MSWWAKSGRDSARWCHGTKSLEHVAKSQNTPLHTKSVTPEVILFRMFHTASCFLSARPMLMSVPNSLTLHDIHAYTLQPFVHSYPPLAIDTIWVWLIRQCVGLCRPLTSKSFATSSNHKNPPNWNLQRNMIQHDHDHHWTLVTTLPPKTKFISPQRSCLKTNWNQRNYRHYGAPLWALAANPSQRPELDCQPWWGAPRNTPDKSSAATAIWQQRFLCTC